MRTTAKFKSVSYDKDLNYEVTFTIDAKYHRQVEKLIAEDEGKYLNLRLDKRVGQRTVRQNNATWKLIRDINIVEHGETNANLEDELYRNIIKLARIDYDIVQVQYFDKEETKIINNGKWCDETKEWIKKPTKTPIQMLSEFYRVVEVFEIRETDKGKNAICFLYRGLSTFNKEENSQFIKVLLDYAWENNIRATLETEELRQLIENN